MKKPKLKHKPSPGRQILEPRGVYKEMATCINKARRKKAITQKELALHFNYHSQHVANWEAGVSLPPVEILKQLAKILKIPIYELIDLRLQEKKREWLRILDAKRR